MKSTGVAEFFWVADAVVESDELRVVALKPLPPYPQAPSGLTASPGDGVANLRWNASPTPGVWYVVEQRVVGASWVRLPIPVTSCCTMQAGYLHNGTTYEFRVRATNAAGDSAPSNVATAALPLVGRCWVIPVTPDIVDYQVQVTNISACQGPIYNVTVTVTMWHFALVQGWVVKEKSTVYRGFVSPHWTGAAIARSYNGPMYCFITQATTRWNWPDGQPGEATLYSPTTYLGRIGQGNCDGVGGI